MPHKLSAVSQISLRLYFFGSFEIEKIISDSQGGYSGTAHVYLPTRKLESLIAYLALNPERHSREKLAALFWGDFGDQQARDSLRNALAVLRKHLGNSLLITTRDSVQLNKDFLLWIDAVEFKKMMDITPQAAVELYRGELLIDYYDDWIVLERDKYRDLYLDTLLRLTQQLRAQSEYDGAIELAHRILKVDTANERAHQTLMFCYVTTGKRFAALNQYEECKRSLRDELDVSPSPETIALYQWIKQQPSTHPAFEARLTNLPIPLTSFIGRQREIREVKEILVNFRLLTLTGAGGSGKTRLAIQVASDCLDSFKDGVWWVELAALTNETHVPQAVAKTLGVQENIQQSLIESILNYLHAKQLLLVLDNCEHLLAATAQLANALLIACPQLRILATSRESLGIGGERVRQVPTMTLPEVRTLSIANYLNYEGIRLFYERAIAIQADFTLTEQNAPTVNEICQRLDGIPLAIEMAAARVQALSIQEIAARLDARFNLLTTGDRALPRHQTLRALIDWSYDLLSPGEQTLLRRLSVFAGGFTLEAAEKVCAYDALRQNQILDLLSHLIAKSLVIVEIREGEARYRMLETIRQYSYENSSEAGETESTQWHHLGYFLKLAEDADAHWNSGEQLILLNRLEVEHDNLRAALAWCSEHDTQSGLRLAIALRQFWILHGYLIEGQQALQNIVAQVPERTLIRANALMSLVTVSFRLGFNTRVEPMIQESLSIYQELHNDANTSQAYQLLGAILLVSGEHERARYAFESSLSLVQTAKLKSGCAVATHFLGVVSEAEGDYSQAKTLMEKSLTLFRELDEQPEICSMFMNVGWIGIGHGRWRVADEETIILLRKIGTRSAIAYTLASLGTLARNEGDYRHAKELLEESLAEFSALGDREGIGQVLGQLGNLARVSGDFQEAKSLFELSLSPRRTIGDRRGIGRTLCNLGNLAASEGNYERAREFLNQSIELFQEMRDKPGLASTFTLLGNVEMAEGNYAQAVSLYERSKDLFQEMTVSHGVAINLMDLADCARLTGDYAAARSRFEESLEIFEKIKHRPGVMLVMEELRSLAREQADRGA